MNSSKTIDSDLLRTFLTVARFGNVTRGAEALRRTQSAVSLQIKRLEECLAVTLFRRERRGVTLTEAGERLWLAADRIVNDLDQTVQGFRADPIGGLVRVGIPDEYGSDVLPAALADFAARYPAVEVYVQCGVSIGFPEAVKRGQLDLAVFADACGPHQSDALRSEALVRDPTVWAASRQFRPNREEPIPLALFDRSCWWRDMALEVLEGAARPYRIVFSSESVSGIKAAIATGLAVGVLARSTVGRTMRMLDERQGLPRLPDSVLRLKRGRDKSPAINAMAAAIEKGFGRLG